MLALPLVGWTMLSAAGYPIGLGGAVVLPPSLPQIPDVHACLRPLHTILDYALYGLILAHLGAALIHGLIRPDDVFSSMAARLTGLRS